MRSGREAVRAFDKDRLRAIAEKPLEHFCEARAVSDGIRAGHCRIANGLDDLVARGLGVGFDRRAGACRGPCPRRRLPGLKCTECDSLPDFLQAQARSTSSARG
jgi:hypothetical protein